MILRSTGREAGAFCLHSAYTLKRVGLYAVFTLLSPCKAIIESSESVEDSLGVFVCEDMNTTDWILQLIDRDELWRFYKTKQWQRLKQQVLEDNHHECRICKQQGKITRYDTGKDGRPRLLSTVHHVNEVRKHPELALTRYYTDHDGNRRENLIPICKDCHNLVHNRKFNGKARRGDCFVNRERW